MRLRRLLLPLVLLALARAPLSAQSLVAVPAGGAADGAAASAAVSAARAVPLTYQARLLSAAPSLEAGPAFLADANAQAWFRRNRPELVPALSRRALELSDWKEVLTGYEDPRLLREAILSRPDSALARDPNALLALVDRTPELAGRRRLVEAAVLDWSIVSDETRALLAEGGVDEDAWSGLDLPGRYELLRRTHALWVERTITAAPGTAEFASQYAKALTRAGGLMTNEELDARVRELTQARDVAAALERARDAVAKAGGDAESAGLLARARSAGDLDEISRRLEPLHRRLGLETPPAPVSAKARLELSPAERSELDAAFYRAILAELGGEPVGGEVRAFLAAHPARFEIAPAPYGAIGALDPNTGDIVIDEAAFVQAAAALGRSPRELLADAGALRELAIVFGHVLVHETTHARQHDWASARLGGRKTPDVYSQQWEFEAFAAQASFLRAKLKSDPAYASLAERLATAGPALGSMLRMPAQMDRDPSGFRAGIVGAYRRVPTLARAGARLIETGQKEEIRGAPALRAIEIELALRRLRARSAGRADGGESKLSGMSTSRLREARRALTDRGAKMTAFVASLLERSALELERLSRGAAAAP